MGGKTKATTIKEKDIIEKKDGESKPMRFKLQDSTYRRKLLGWICLPIGMLNLGILDSQEGATMLDLQLMTSTDDQMAALYITSYSLGYLLGSLLAGYFYGKVNSYLVLAVCSVLAGGANIATPYCSTFMLMFIIRCIMGFFLGVVLCTTTAEHMHIWGTKGESLLQLLHCLYAMGGAVGPAMTASFITEIDRNNKSTRLNETSGDFINNNMTFNNSVSQFVTCDNVTYYSMTTGNFINHNLTFDNFINLTLECHNQTETNKSNLPRSTNVRYAFLIGGLISVLVAIPFLITLLKSNKSNSHVKERVDPDIPDRKLPLLLKVSMAGLLFLYYLFYSSVELTFNYYLLVFIVKHFDNIGTHEAAYVMTYYWALFAAGRFISIFTSKYVTAEKLLYIHLSMTACTFAGFIVSALSYRFDILTVFACLMGLSFSASFPAGFSLTEAELMKVTGPISAVMLISTATGTMVAPFVVGHLVEYVSDMWFCYSIVVVFVLAVSVLAIMMTFNRCYVDRKYGKLGAVLGPEKPLGLPDIVVQTTYL